MWRSRGTNRLDLIHEYRQSSEIGGQSQPGTVICENVTLQVSEYFEVLPGDVLGVYIPLSTSTVSIIAQSTLGSQLQFDTRQDFDSNRIQRRDLIELSEIGFHLYGRIGKYSK